MMFVSSFASIAAWADYEDPPFPLGPCFIPVYILQSTALLTLCAALVATAFNWDQVEARWAALVTGLFLTADACGITTLVLLSSKASGTLDWSWVYTVTPVGIGIALASAPIFFLAGIPVVFREAKESEGKWRGFYAMRLSQRAAMLGQVSCCLAQTPEMAAIAVSRNTWGESKVKSGVEMEVDTLHRMADVIRPALLDASGAGRVADEVMVLGDGSVRAGRAVGILPRANLPDHMGSARRHGVGQDRLEAAIGATSQEEASVMLYGAQGRGL